MYREIQFSNSRNNLCPSDLYLRQTYCVDVMGGAKIIDKKKLPTTNILLKEDPWHLILRNAELFTKKFVHPETPGKGQTPSFSQLRKIVYGGIVFSL